MKANEINKVYRGVEGWGKPGHSDEQHYFIGTLSLCKKWGFFSSMLKETPLEAFPICKECADKHEHN